MSVREQRCGCGALVKLPNLKARAVLCDGCYRARSQAEAMRRIREHPPLTAPLEEDSIWDYQPEGRMCEADKAQAEQWVKDLSFDGSALPSLLRRVW